MRPGWYILNYHDVSWEDSYHTRAIGGTVRPDVFADHLEQLARLGRLVSVTEGLDTLAADRIREPLFSVWFDDGFAGVRRYARPLLDKHGVTGAVSICSRFVSRQEMFWRAELSYLAHVDGLRFLRPKLRRLRGKLPKNLRGWLIENFDLEVRETVSQTYREHCPENVARDAFRIFDDIDGLRSLGLTGWTVCNHSAAHYPLSGVRGHEELTQEMLECEDLVREVGGTPDLWVVPFGVGVDRFRSAVPLQTTVVDVGNRENDTASFRETNTLYRFAAPSRRDVKSAFS